MTQGYSPMHRQTLQRSELPSLYDRTLINKYGVIAYLRKSLSQSLRLSAMRRSSPLHPTLKLRPSPLLNMAAASALIKILRAHPIMEAIIHSTAIQLINTTNLASSFWTSPSSTMGFTSNQLTSRAVWSLIRRALSVCLRRITATNPKAQSKMSASKTKGLLII